MFGSKLINTYSGAGAGCYNMASATYSGNMFTYNLPTGETEGRGIAFNPEGTIMLINGRDTDLIYEFNLSTAYNVSTAVYSGNSINNQTSYNIPNGMGGFSPDGLKLFGTYPTGIIVYNFTNPYDITSFTNTNGSSGITEVPNIQDIAISTDGTMFFLIDGTQDAWKVYSYNMTTAWDITTRIFIGTYSIGYYPTSINFNGDGTLMIIGNFDSNTSFYVYNLSTGWDISTATYSYAKIITEGWNSQDVAFLSNGTKFYNLCGYYKEIYEYDLTC